MDQVINKSTFDEKTFDEKTFDECLCKLKSINPSLINDYLFKNDEFLKIKQKLIDFNPNIDSNKKINMDLKIISAKEFASNSNIELEQIFNQCFQLLRKNMKALYELSTWGWSNKNKLDEMIEEDKIYIILLNHDKDNSITVNAFCSFEITYENNTPSVYCFELQVQKSSRGLGFGKWLLQAIEIAGRNVFAEKCFLTVFYHNPAKEFYFNQRYNISPTSPKSKTLRNGRVYPPGYLILEKSIKEV